LAELEEEEMDRLEELIKKLPREIQQNFVNILEFIFQKSSRQAHPKSKLEKQILSAAPPIYRDPSEKSKRIGQARADFVRLYNRARREAGLGRKMKAGADFIKTYKMGTWPELYAILKHKVSLSTAARWAAVIGKSGDPSDLAPKHGEHRRGKIKMTPEQELCLREAALIHPDWPMTEVVRAAQKMMAAKGIKDNLHQATHLRYLRRRKRNPPLDQR
jgi:hypothetical protein